MGLATRHSLLATCSAGSACSIDVLIERLVTSKTAFVSPSLPPDKLFTRLSSCLNQGGSHAEWVAQAAPGIIKSQLLGSAPAERQGGESMVRPQGEKTDIEAIMALHSVLPVCLSAALYFIITDFHQ